jgi:cell division protein ZapA (FtsZ GTPase activity inhibitor)
MSGQRQSVRVVIGGLEFTVSSEHPPEYTKEVAQYLDAALAKIRTSLPSVDAHKAAILAGLAITDELFQARQADAKQAARLRQLRERMARLVPPPKRGGRHRA